MRKIAYLLVGLILAPTGYFVQRNLRFSSFRDIAVKEGAWYDVRMYDAIAGDQISDVPAGQAAADSINSDGGGTLFFPPGQYEFYGDSIRIYSNTTVWAYGAVFNDTTGGAEFFWISGDSDIVFLGGEWNGNADIDGGYTEFDHGITIIDAFRVTVQDAYMHDLAGDGVYIADSDDAFVTNCTIVSTHLQDSPFIGRNSVAVVEGNNIEIVKNILKGGDPANVDIEPNAALAITNVLIENNIMTGGQFGVSLNAGAASSTADSIKVSGNIISATLEIGIHITQASHYDIVGNEVNSSGQDGIRVKSSGGGLASHYGNISNNDVFNSDSSGAANYHGILLGQDLEHISVKNNRVSFSGGSGIRVAGSSGNENKWINVTDNVCWNNDKSSGGSDGGIDINFTDSSYVAGNNCYDDQGGLATQTFGFIYSQMDINVIGLGNTGYGNVTRLNSYANMSGESYNSLVALQWLVDNPAAGATNVAMQSIGSSTVNGIHMAFGGQVVGMSATTTAAPSAETIQFLLVKNGSNSGMNSVTLGTASADTSENYFGYTDTNHTFVLGDLIGVIYTTHGSYAPTTLDYVVTVWIRH